MGNYQVRTNLQHTSPAELWAAKNPVCEAGCTQDSLGAMSFARRLSQRSSAAEARQLADDRREIQEWVRGAVANFEEKCEEASERAERNACISVKCWDIVQSLQRLHKEALKTALRQALAGHGFSTLHVKFCFKTTMMEINASWAQMASSDESLCEEGAGCQQAGLVKACGICNEDPG